MEDINDKPFVAAGTVNFSKNLISDTALTYTYIMEEWETKEEKAKKQREERLKKLDRIL